MNVISELSWSGDILSWKYRGQLFGLTFKQKIENAIILRSEGIAIIAGWGSDAVACIINADGKLRATLQNPYNWEEGMEFYYFLYERSILVVILAGRTCEIAYQVDENTGALSYSHVSR